MNGAEQQREPLPSSSTSYNSSRPNSRPQPQQPVQAQSQQAKKVPVFEVGPFHYIPHAGSLRA
jgi:hypothetical protein